ncbi:MAG: Uma2 family endonuclease [Microcystaceae cyanobacterium]
MVQVLAPPLSAYPYTVSWDKLPDDFILPDDPVDNLNQPLLAAALTEGLANAGKLSETRVTTTDYGICARLDQRFVVKAPDWSYITNLKVPKSQIERSYTPHLQGDPPLIVMEFISDTDGGEYSIKSTYPPGKWFFYEKILRVPYYVIFDWQTEKLELYQLNAEGSYECQSPNQLGLFWIASLELSLGIWVGTREFHHRPWLRWWTAEGELVPWSSELVLQANQLVQQANQLAQQANQRAERLAALLRSQGIDPDSV